MDRILWILNQPAVKHLGLTSLSLDVLREAPFDQALLAGPHQVSTEVLQQTAQTKG